MTKNFYKDHLKINYEIETIVPEAPDIEAVSRIIYEELCKGIITTKSKNYYLSVISQLQKQGAQGVILGCTEIPLLISTEDTDLEVFDTTYLHSKMVVDFILN